MKICGKLSAVVAAVFAIVIQTTSTAQTIAPNGAVLWTKTLTNNTSSAQSYLTADESTLVVASYLPYNGEGYAVTRINLNDLTSIDDSTTAPNYVANSLRLRGKGVTLTDGGFVTWTNEYYQHSIDRIGSWSITFPPDRYYLMPKVATASDKLIGVYGDGDPWSRVYGISEINGATGQRRSISFPGFLSDVVGVAAGGLIVVLTSDNTVTLLRQESFESERTLSWNADWKLFSTAMVVTTDGHILFSGINGNKCGLIALHPTGATPSRFIEFPDRDVRITGMAVGSDSFVYCTTSDGSIPFSNEPYRKRGGLCRVNIRTEEISLMGNIVDAIDSPPVITKKGEVIVVSSSARRNPSDSTLVAIATGSVGGLAKTAWPRSTADNQGTYREQVVIDTDNDGLTDVEERSTYGTDPVKTDTDNDGYSDLVEVSNGSNPLSSSDVPEIMESRQAMKLTFGTNMGRRYQLQSSVNLQVWNDVGGIFSGTGSKQSQMVDPAETGRYWRLKRVE